MSDQWYLKKYDDGSVFGPVEVARLHEWASKGEISPYDMLSRDAVKWMAAPELATLDMNWIVEFPDGEMYGPTCIPAIRAFVQDGQLTPDNSIRNATTGEKCLIAEHPDFQDLVGGNSEATAEAAATTDPAGEADSLRQRMAELEATSQEMQAEHEATVQQLNEQLAAARDQEQSLRSELDTLQQNSLSELAPNAPSPQQVRSELAQVREQFELLSDLNNQLRKNYEDTLADLHQKIEAVLETLDGDSQREVELNRQLAEAAHREAQYREQIVSLEKELVKTQQAHAELLAKFAQLNDKLTQYLSKKKG